MERMMTFFNFSKKKIFLLLKIKFSDVEKLYSIYLLFSFKVFILFVNFSPFSFFSFSGRHKIDMKLKKKRQKKFANTFTQSLKYSVAETIKVFCSVSSIFN